MTRGPENITRKDQVMKNHADKITLKGKLNIELIPNSKWRELARRGVRSMFYVVSGHAVIDGEERAVNVRVPALSDGQLVGLGEARPWGTGEPTEIVPGPLYPKNPSMSEDGKGLDTVTLATDTENKVLIDEATGMPVYADAPILIEEGENQGQEFDLMFGTHFFCPSKSGLTIEFRDVSLAETDRNDKVTKLPFVNASSCDYTVVAAKSARAKGAVLNIVCKAARATAKTVAEDIAEEV